jgi:glutamine---fructose-6-phosphate transaminase (isomerizing)
MSLWEEIHQQPEVLSRILESNRASIDYIAGRLRDHAFSYVLIAARGTSDNAARYAQYVWGSRNQLPVALAAPSLFGPYQSPPQLDHSLVVGISQSGESPDLLAVLSEARRQGRPTLAITNHAGSPLAAVSDLVLELHAGPEGAVAATKTYTAQLMAVAMLSAAMDQDPVLTSEELAAVPANVDTVLAGSEPIASAAAAVADVDRAAVLGRGYHQATAFEWALKLQELAYLVAQPYSTADFQHGPVALVEPGFPILAIATEGALYGDLELLLGDLRRRGAEVIALSDHPQCPADHLMGLPVGMAEWLAPIPAIVAGQLFTYHLTVAKGLDPDHPRGLRKVTRTL